jgi:AcrR family transcriptional regulator
MGRSRGQRAGLDRHAVLREALALTDSEGLAAVSLRRLAARLGVTPNAIYNHVPDRAAIIDGLLDLALSDVAVPRHGSWRMRLEQLMMRTWTAIVARPDLVPHYLSRQTLGPEALRLGRATLALLSEGGVEERQATEAMRVLMIHTIAFAAMRLPGRAPRNPETDTPPPRAGAVEPPPPSRDQYEATFRSGLRWLLDGLAADVLNQTHPAH